MRTLGARVRTAWGTCDMTVFHPSNQRALQDRVISVFACFLRRSGPTGYGFFRPRRAPQRGGAAGRRGRSGRLVGRGGQHAPAWGRGSWAVWANPIFQNPETTTKGHQILIPSIKECA